MKMEGRWGAVGEMDMHQRKVAQTGAVERAIDSSNVAEA